MKVVYALKGVFTPLRTVFADSTFN